MTYKNINSREGAPGISESPKSPEENTWLPDELARTAIDQFEQEKIAHGLASQLGRADSLPEFEDVVSTACRLGIAPGVLYRYLDGIYNTLNPPLREYNNKEGVVMRNYSSEDDLRLGELTFSINLELMKGTFTANICNEGLDGQPIAPIEENYSEERIAAAATIFVNKAIDLYPSSGNRADDKKTLESIFYNAVAKNAYAFVHSSRTIAERKASSIEAGLNRALNSALGRLSKLGAHSDIHSDIEKIEKILSNALKCTADIKDARSELEEWYNVVKE